MYVITIADIKIEFTCYQHRLWDELMYKLKSIIFKVKIVRQKRSQFVSYFGCET